MCVCVCECRTWFSKFVLGRLYSASPYPTFNVLLPSMRLQREATDDGEGGSDHNTQLQSARVGLLCVYESSKCDQPKIQGLAD